MDVRSVTDFSGRSVNVDPGLSSLEGLTFKPEEGSITFPPGARTVQVLNDDGTS